LINTKITLEELNSTSETSMTGHLGIRYTLIEENQLSATMPVSEKTTQPFGILHGGASVTLAESLGSMAAHCSIDSSKYVAVGLEINANHIRSVRSGLVTGTATPIHVGRSTHVWKIDIVNEDNKLVCTSRITMAIIDKK
jgi:1,4-dihydroxy-2-naphthoyl-CoA hydrolase